MNSTSRKPRRPSRESQVFSKSPPSRATFTQVSRWSRKPAVISATSFDESASCRLQLSSRNVKMESRGIKLTAIPPASYPALVLFLEQSSAMVRASSIRYRKSNRIASRGRTKYWLPSAPFSKKRSWLLIGLKKTSKFRHIITFYLHLDTVLTDSIASYNHTAKPINWTSTV